MYHRTSILSDTAKPRIDTLLHNPAASEYRYIPNTTLFKKVLILASSVSKR
ncbi:hypothetical protein GJA_1463 [Janthinobacterium agaricidamnosum NBRC 102515 = DSM 9628]|uniref:Uncharacterized protein n=1 Tax=Janthinobacterium agaricidamnosum NBRC 102515 = DSM 9628 TaxID=1349767 RepID=W0UZW4_9BURK|nr:hypothetical protein GJA_1463 [Janthinobacterium agaricidamnosum NBRC 102515 = DSM 9628]